VDDNRKMNKVLVEIKKVCFSYGTELVVDHLDLKVRNAEILTVVGPSGCGKSTFLRLIAGLERPNSGKILIYQSEKENKNLRFLFQDYDAFPWYTTWENVKKSAPKNQYPCDEEVKAILQRVSLWDSRNKYPGELSGGMRKRLALVRCLVVNPPLLLLDEPFSKLDVDTRYEMYTLLQELWQEYQQTIILVTHDLHEAIFLGSRILVSTRLPFSVRKIIDIPFQYPRTDSITTTQSYLQIMQDLRKSLRPISKRI